jgi:hypothetical protein
VKAVAFRGATITGSVACWWPLVNRTDRAFLYGGFVVAKLKRAVEAISGRAT